VLVPRLCRFNHICRCQNLLLNEFVPTEFRKPRAGFTSWLAPSYSEAIARMQAFDEACRRCAQEIGAGQFDLLFANSSVGYYVPFILRHLDMRKVLYLQEPCGSYMKQRQFCRGFPALKRSGVRLYSTCGGIWANLSQFADSAPASEAGMAQRTGLRPCPG